MYRYAAHFALGIKHTSHLNLLKGMCNVCVKAVKQMFITGVTTTLNNQVLVQNEYVKKGIKQHQEKRKQGKDDTARNEDIHNTCFSY